MKVSVRAARSIGFLIATLLIISCSDDKAPIVPYRGEWLANLSIGEDLKKYLMEEKGLDPEKNCVQMITRDRVNDRIRRIERLVIFSPDPCPAEGTVAEREAFAVNFLKVHIAEDAALPQRAYFLMTGNTVVGDVTMTGDEPNAFELASLCAIETDNYIKDNCDIDVSHEGTFAQLTVLRADLSRPSPP